MKPYHDTHIHNNVHVDMKNQTVVVCVSHLLSRSPSTREELHGVGRGGPHLRGRKIIVALTYPVTVDCIAHKSTA